MNKPNIYKGDLVKEAREGKHDIVVHCVDVSNNWDKKDSLSKQLDDAFNLKYLTPKNVLAFNNIDMLGNISVSETYMPHIGKNGKTVYFITCFVAINQDAKDSDYNTVDYHFLESCLRKIEYRFRGRTISMGTLGMGNLKGHKDTITKLIGKTLLRNCNVTIVLKQ